MLEEHVLVTPLRGGEATVKLEGTNHGFGTALSWRLVEGVDIVDGGVGWDTGFELMSVGHVVGTLKFIWDQVLD